MRAVPDAKADGRPSTKKASRKAAQGEFSMNMKSLPIREFQCPHSGVGAVHHEQRPAWCMPPSLRFVLLVAAAVLLLAPFADAQTNWVLVWSDEFNGAAGPFTPTSSNNQF